MSRVVRPDRPEALAAREPASEHSPTTLASSPSTGETDPGARVLANYLPRHRLERLRALAAAPATAPHEETADVALLFLDLTGFTRLTEEHARRGRAGAEELAELLDRLFGRVGVLVTQTGGDLLTVAGDAALAMFPVGAEVDSREAVRRAAACGLVIQRELATRPIERLAELRLRAGVAFGEVRLLELGGVHGRWESLVAGAPLVDLVSEGPLKLRLNVPSFYLTQLKVGVPFDVTVNETGKTYQAKVSAVNARVDAVAQTVELEAHIDGDPPELLAGMSGIARFSFQP